MRIPARSHGPLDAARAGRTPPASPDRCPAPRNATACRDEDGRRTAGPKIGNPACHFLGKRRQTVAGKTLCVIRPLSTSGRRRAGHAGADLAARQGSRLRPRPGGVPSTVGNGRARCPLRIVARGVGCRCGAGHVPVRRRVRPRAVHVGVGRPPVGSGWERLPRGGRPAVHRRSGDRAWRGGSGRPVR
jgi:hypothetical protein